ncbi:hypothetical protein F5Y19DRAFT_415022 [Xylariaceae sp. FL1651]|nr:hypothetical protein F5Y19DRAFT_415022 [Xylariaceae sp. FL1651]
MSKRQKSGESAQKEEDARQRRNARDHQPNRFFTNTAGLAPIPENIAPVPGNNNPIAENDIPLPDDNGYNRQNERFSRHLYQEASENLVILLKSLDRTNIIGIEINIATLQRMNMHVIRKEIVDLTYSVVRRQRLDVMREPDGGGSQSEKLRSLMKEYCTALRDWDFILSRTSTADNDPFRISSHEQLSMTLLHEAGFLDREFLQPLLPRDRRGRQFGLRLQMPQWYSLPGDPRHAKLETERQTELIVRFGWTVAGSLFLLVPVLIMVLVPSLLASLIVTSVSILLFAFVISQISEGFIPGLALENFGLKDALASTLAYAAVLVVFLGLRA